MRSLVLDASVIVKSLLGDPGREADTERAVEIFEAVQAEIVELVQPPHWLAEVAGVLVRLSPVSAEEDVRDLVTLELDEEDTPEVYLLASRLAIDLNQHVFDTLYHAVALSRPGTVLVTADERYYRRARHLGGISLLADWRPAGE